ncbi:MAG: DUF4294 domain-containing protein [Prevotellaceae bacterium]|jgi:hypothetical protein|nr:DUF4294 domain-containing protein [Prevotellaceae bacterium]
MRFIANIICFVIFSTLVFAENNNKETAEGVWMAHFIDESGNTVYLAPMLPAVYVFPKLVFKNKKEEKFYWKTVRDVKVTLPYAKLISRLLFDTEQHLKTLTPEEQKKYLKKYEKEIFRKYEKDLRRMTRSQGQMLIRLIDRECDRRAYDLVKTYRGSTRAFFWQGIGRIFGLNLKTDYDGDDRDKIIERVIILVESGGL